MSRRTLLLALGAGLVVWLALPTLGAARFLSQLTGQPDWLQPWLANATVAVEDIDVPTRTGAIGARAYRPDGTARRTLVVVPGIHAGGVEEPRLDALARRLASTGSIVISLPLPDLRQFLITPASTDQIEDAVAWVSRQPSLAPAGRVALVGVSFGGGLAVVAAGRPAIRDRLSTVVSIGGHGDLPRVLRFLCTGAIDDGQTMAPHDYGVAVLLLAAADKVAPPEQAAALADGVREFLVASSIHATDAARAAGMLADVTARADRMDEPSRSLLRAVLARDVAALGPALLPWVDELGGDPSLSPERSAPPSAPVFLLHGTTDNVIPPTETPRLAQHLERAGAPNVRALISPAVTHADIRTGIGVGDGWALIRFWRDLLAAG
ncbi:MAG TPA: alpha/beta fold hydrolase [Vicinamibacterales bacterium]|nr:alpha/beta fold hydrolase [Vicinamibacterales bacterium]